MCTGLRQRAAAPPLPEPPGIILYLAELQIENQASPLLTIHFSGNLRRDFPTYTLCRFANKYIIIISVFSTSQPLATPRRRGPKEHYTSLTQTQTSSHPAHSALSVSRNIPRSENKRVRITASTSSASSTVPELASHSFILLLGHSDASSLSSGEKITSLT